ncbi:MAG: hypothetical protein ACI9KE_004452, partial [Polyangiales bacterium]
MSDGEISDTRPDQAKATEGLRRATLEIELDGRTELVALALREGEWIATSTDGLRDGPHVEAALLALGLTSTSSGGHARIEHAAALPEARP